MSVTFSNMNAGSGRTPAEKQTKQTNKPHCQANLLSPTEKCKVCKEPAAKHIHYGAMTCFSCRAFFRRSIQNKTSGTYVCRRSQNCDISLKTRKNCQYCRYQLCLRVGMKPSWVLSEEERSRRFKKQRQKAKDKQLATEGDTLMADDDDEEFIRNSGEFDMGDFLDADNIEAFVSLSTPVTISSQSVMSGPSQIQQQVQAGQRQIYDADYSQHQVKIEQDIKQEPQFFASSPRSAQDAASMVITAAPTTQTIVVQRRKFENMGGVMTVLVENRQKRQENCVNGVPVTSPVSSVHTSNGSNVIVRFPHKEANVASPMSLSNISSAVDGISQNVLSPSGCEPVVKPLLVSQSSTSSRSSVGLSPAPSLGCSSVTSGIHSPGSSLCPSPVSRMEMTGGSLDDSMDVSVFEEQLGQPRGQYQLHLQETASSQEGDHMGLHPMYERMGSLNPLPPGGSPQFEHPTSHVPVSRVYPQPQASLPRAPQKRASYPPPHPGSTSNPRSPQDCHQSRLQANSPQTRPIQQQQGMGMDPRVSQHDPRSTQHDPRSTQHDPRVTQIDPRAMQHDPRPTQHDPRSTQHDPRSIQHDPRATQHDPRSTHHDPRDTQHDPRVTQHQHGPRVSQHPSGNVAHLEAPPPPPPQQQQQQQNLNGQQISHERAPQQVISLHQRNIQEPQQGLAQHQQQQEPLQQLRVKSPQQQACHQQVAVTPTVATIPEEASSPCLSPSPANPLDQVNLFDGDSLFSGEQSMGCRDSSGPTKNLQKGRLKSEVHFCSISPCDASRYFNSYEDAKIHMMGVHGTDHPPQSILIYDEENPEEDDDADRRSRSSNSVYSEEHYTTSSEDEDIHPKKALDPYCNEPEIIFGEDEKCALKEIVQKHDERYRSVNFGEALIKEMIMCSMFGIPISANAALAGYRLSVERITRIAHDLHSFRALSKDDQSSLLKENADLLVSLRSCVFFDARKKGVDQVLISMGIDDMETIKNVFKPIMKEGNSQLKHIDYKTFNSIQTITDSATEVRYNYLQEKVAQQLGDDVIPILLTYIILFSCDMTSLLDRHHVEKIQDQYTRMLQRYLYSKHPRRTASLILAEALCSITRIREMAEIKKRRMINSNVKI